MAGAGLVVITACLTAVCPAVAAGPPTVTAFHLQHDGNGATAVFTVPTDLDYRVFTLSHPARIVLDLLNAALAHGLRLTATHRPLVKNIRWATRFDGKGVRVVFDLATSATPRSFLRHGKSGETLVLQFNDSPAAKAAADNAGPRAAPKPLRDVIVAIDPGHGGRDSGAIGPDGLEEKTVTLAIAKDLYAKLEKVPGIKPVLTRTGDYYVSLAGRRKIAREDHADLFISIHADSSPYHYPKGSTVYVLSEHGASSVAARILAESENSSDEVAGVNLANEQPVVRSTILSLSQQGSIAQSSRLARIVMHRINSILPLHSDQVERADFVVLKSPDIPSILVETAFISNRTEEHLLATAIFRDRIASAIAKGVENYADRFAPPGTLIAARRNALYTLQQG